MTKAEIEVLRDEFNSVKAEVDIQWSRLRLLFYKAYKIGSTVKVKRGKMRYLIKVGVVDLMAGRYDFRLKIFNPVTGKEYWIYDYDLAKENS